eukprot:GHVU01209796.1.p1 GENE.GHVU01209796.1~~GHVU01209796.1.p1  ORF type:complete len:105 (+),score=9.42 GHVU01209796.1:298-612(+)
MEAKKGKAFDEVDVMIKFYEQLKELYLPVWNWDQFISTEIRNPTASNRVFKVMKPEEDYSDDNTYDLLLLAGTVSRSWKPEARAGRSRTGTCLCPNLPWPRRWY